MGDDFRYFTIKCDDNKFDDAINFLISQPPDSIEKNALTIATRVDKLIAEKKFTEALAITTARAAYGGRLKKYLLSIEITCLFKLHKIEEFKLGMNKWMQLGYEIGPVMGIMFGRVLINGERYKEALDVTRKALNILYSTGRTLKVPADNEEHVFLNQRLNTLLQQAEAGLEKQTIKANREAVELLAIVTKEDEEKERIVREEKERIVVREEKERIVREEKERIVREEKERIVREEKERAEKVKENAEKGKRKKSDDKEHDKDEHADNITRHDKDAFDSQPKRLKVQIPLEIDIPFDAFDNECAFCFNGTIKSNTSSYFCGMVKAQTPHVLNIQELMQKCAKHESLLTIGGVVKVGEVDVLLSEEIYDIQAYFLMKVKELGAESKSIWSSLGHLFWQVFRDISGGLIHLFRGGEACGDLCFNTFVTREGRGRILPSMVSCKKKDDWLELVKLMKSVISILGENDMPEELSSFISLASHKDILANSNIPLEFLIDHPYFWTSEEKKRFALNVRKLIKSGDIYSALDKELQIFEDYDNWSSKLSKVYKGVWDYAEQKKGAVPYKNRVDVIRYYWSVLTHANEGRYKPLRGKKLTDEDIVSGLHSYFPTYHQDVFTCLCKAACKKPEHIGPKELGSLASR